MKSFIILLAVLAVCSVQTLAQEQKEAVNVNGDHYYYSDFVVADQNGNGGDAAKDNVNADNGAVIGDGAGAGNDDSARADGGAVSDSGAGAGDGAIGDNNGGGSVDDQGDKGSNLPDVGGDNLDNNSGGIEVSGNENGGNLPDDNISSGSGLSSEGDVPIAAPETTTRAPIPQPKPSRRRVRRNQGGKRNNAATKRPAQQARKPVARPAPARRTQTPARKPARSTPNRRAQPARRQNNNRRAQPARRAKSAGGRGNRARSLNSGRAKRG